MPDPHPGSTPRHRRITAPSPWVVRFAPLVARGGPVLDVACGGGRHTRLFLDRGHPVTAIDRDVSAFAAPTAQPREGPLEVIAADLEGNAPWPPGRRRFAAVVVTNYLHRPLFPTLLAALAPGGVLIYETFARGHERFARPRNPDHLLRHGELLDLARGRLQVVAFEHGLVEADPLPGVVERLCAVADLPNHDQPPPHRLVPGRAVSSAGSK